MQRPKFVISTCTCGLPKPSSAVLWCGFFLAFMLDPQKRVQMALPCAKGRRASSETVLKGYGLGFRVWGLGFRVWGLGFRVFGV